MRIAVLGAGHMGTWLVRMLSPNNELCVYDVDKTRLTKLPGALVLGKYAGLKGFKPELIINSASLQNTLEAYESALPHISKACILADVASVKGKIPEYYGTKPHRFVSVHPMFGPTFANVDRLSNENVIIIRESDQEGAQFFRNFFFALGLNIFEYSFDEHDRMIAYSLTLPFASTMVFAACMDKRAVPGTTFKKHLEIARGLLSEDDYLLSEILFNPHSLPQLEKVTGRLDFLKHVIRERDAEEARKFLNRLRENIEK
jgi:prephenate dehydrogenase